MPHLDDGLFGSFYISGEQVRRSVAGDLVPNGSPDQVTGAPKLVAMTREEVVMIVAALQANDIN